MTLSKKLILFLFFQLLLFITILVYFIYNYLYPSYIRFEKSNAHKTVDQILYTIKSEQHHLNTFAMDWSMWDEMVRFVQTKDERFIQKNFSPQVQKTYHIDLITIFDAEGKLLSFHNSFNAPLSILTKDIITPTNTLLPIFMLYPKNQPYDRQGHSGLCWIDNKLMIITILPIYPNTPSGSPKGYLLFGRYLSGSLLSQIEQQTGTPLHLSPLASLSPDIKDHLVHAPPHSYLDKYASLHLSTYTILPDISSRSTIALSTQTQRLIFQKAQESIRQFIMMIIIVGCMFVIFSLLFMHFLILKPIRKLQLQMHSIIDNKTFEPIQQSSLFEDEFTDLTDQFNRLIDHVQEQNSALEELSLIDPLTSLQNRRALDQYISVQCGYLSRHKQSLSAIMVDIDHFKHYNDTYGHLGGDEVIVTVAKIILQNTSRSSDFVARYGGEEFLILLPNTSLQGAETVAQKIHDDLRSMALEHKASPTADHITLSIGIAAALLENKQKAFEIIKSADIALYEAKHNGRNRMVAHSY